MTISKYADKLIERVNRVEEKLIKKFSKKLGAKSSTIQTAHVWFKRNSKIKSGC